MLFTDVTAVYSDIKQAINIFCLLLLVCLLAQITLRIIMFLRNVNTLLQDMLPQLFIITSETASDFI
jgi:hypothetical protein